VESPRWSEIMAFTSGSSDGNDGTRRGSSDVRRWKNLPIEVSRNCRARDQAAGRVRTSEFSLSGRKPLSAKPVVCKCPRRARLCRCPAADRYPGQGSRWQPFDRAGKFRPFRRMPGLDQFEIACELASGHFVFDRARGGIGRPQCQKCNPARSRRLNSREGADRWRRGSQIWLCSTIEAARKRQN